MQQSEQVGYNHSGLVPNHVFFFYRQHLKKCVGESLLIIQCDSGDVNANLIACARYCVMDEYQKMREELPAPVHIMIIVQLPNIAGISYTGFQVTIYVFSC